MTDNAQIPEEDNLPPSIVTGENANTMGVGLGQIIELNLETFEGSELRIPVIVRDPNIDQVLEYNAYVDFEGSIAALVAGGSIQPSGEACEQDQCLERFFELQVPITELLDPGCHKIELLVSARFSREGAFRQSVDPVDNARAVWWVRAADSMTTTVDLMSCPSF